MSIRKPFVLLALVPAVFLGGCTSFVFQPRSSETAAGIPICPSPYGGECVGGVSSPQDQSKYDHPMAPKPASRGN